MDSIIKIGQSSYVIAYITHVYINGCNVIIKIAGDDDKKIKRFDDYDEANDFYDDCLAKIDAYYKAMMPPRLSKSVFD